MLLLKIIFRYLLLAQAVFTFEYNSKCTFQNATAWTQGPFKFWCQRQLGQSFGRARINGCVSNRVPQGYVQGCQIGTAGAELFYASCLQNIQETLSCPGKLFYLRI